MSRSSLQRARAQGRREERAAVVAWLRTHPTWTDADMFADAIEAREHLDEQGRAVDK